MGQFWLVFEICRTNEWQYLFTFKDGNLKSVWEQVEDELLGKIKDEKTHFLSSQKEHVIKQKIRWYLNYLVPKSVNP
jgi:hypothetical protein